MSIDPLLTQLRTSFKSANLALPEEATCTPSPDGITLLELKNELLVEYLQNLVFLAFFKLHNQRHTPAHSPHETDITNEDTAARLAKLRVHLEKGVRPLEGRIKYQIDKVTRAAEIAEDMSAQGTRYQKGRDGTRHEVIDDNLPTSEAVDQLTHRPNFGSFAPVSPLPHRNTVPQSKNDAVYRPPRNAPLTPYTQSAFEDRQKASRKPLRSHTIDSYIDTEMYNLPMEEPSIGSTIVAGGRHTKSDKDRREESERTSYEEANFTRLASTTKIERAKKAARQRGGFGGEELRGIGDGLDRIDRMVAKRRPPVRDRNAASENRDAKRRKVGLL